jgi:type IV secretory pathway VirJ component
MDKRAGLKGRLYVLTVAGAGLWCVVVCCVQSERSSLVRQVRESGEAVRRLEQAATLAQAHAHLSSEATTPKPAQAQPQPQPQPQEPASPAAPQVGQPEHMTNLGGHLSLWSLS